MYVNKKTLMAILPAFAFVLTLIGPLPSPTIHAHEPIPPSPSAEKPDLERQRFEKHRLFWSTFLSEWPTRFTERIIEQAWQEKQLVDGLLPTTAAEKVEVSQLELQRSMQETLPSIHLTWHRDEITLESMERTICVTPGIDMPLLVKVENASTSDKQLQVGVGFGNHSATPEFSKPPVNLAVGEAGLLHTRLRFVDATPGKTNFTLTVRNPVSGRHHQVRVPIQIRPPSRLRGTIFADAQRLASPESVESSGDTLTPAIVPARIIVETENGVLLHGGPFGRNKTLTDKPIIYPPIDAWQKTDFFYTDGQFDLEVPPGKISITVERGYDYQRAFQILEIGEGQTIEVGLHCKPLIEAATDSWKSGNWEASGWVSGDTHVHWVTNAWNVDEPLDLLAMVQRAEGLQVANNLTLLQRYADQAFIKPSQAPMGPIPKYSDDHYHMQMGEEYRNENLYGHLCFLNIEWLVQPIGTGPIIAGPDALDFPLNRTAIEACRRQGGISIEAHGTGGNKDVPSNVIHNLTDSLDQMEPEMYYRFLDCGFQLPLTNGSDHPARTLGAARTYVQLDDEFSYENWIQGIRRGRTMTTSGPLLNLKVNEARIGDRLEAADHEMLVIKAHALSRDPIGRLQIISNQEVIAEDWFDGNEADLEVSIPAGESRWIIARCSSRSDGRAEFGFGDFNAITGPGIAHTSPIYVEVDGKPRVSSPAIDYWIERLQLHRRDIIAKGTFADLAQQRLATDYIDRGIAMYRHLAGYSENARSRSELRTEMKQRLLTIVHRMGSSSLIPNPLERARILERVQASQTRVELSKALAELTLLDVSINPESRVKLTGRMQRVALKQGRPQRFLIQVENIAGSSAPLRLSGYDLTQSLERQADWCDLQIIDSPFTSRFLTGAEHEWKVLELTPFVEGLRELRIVGDAGQGTQELGFRATADVLFDIEPKRVPNPIESQALPNNEQE